MRKMQFSKYFRIFNLRVGSPAKKSQTTLKKRMDATEIVEDSKENTHNQKYSFEEDMAIVKYITTNERYFNASGIKVWKDAEKMNICPGRPYLSLKERYRKVIVKNFKKYNVDHDLAVKITQFMTANRKGKSLIRLKEMKSS